MGTHGKMESKVKSESMYASVFLTNIKLGIKREREGESSLNLRSRKTPEEDLCEMEKAARRKVLRNAGGILACFKRKLWRCISLCFLDFPPPCPFALIKFN